MPRLAIRLHAMEEIPRHTLHLQSEEIADLRASDQNSDAVGETDHYRPRENT